MSRIELTEIPSQLILHQFQLDLVAFEFYSWWKEQYAQQECSDSCSVSCGRLRPSYDLHFRMNPGAPISE
ncbi:hypothetical protein FGO68_gene15565 [Halteria grandinella]|uniref:Uncharacterized protein n=1 Tax=Halteria grandinella TaxID=5974 RepID=A0A8J8NHQ5_HALGN|nr:hypothetical protein FGO68_gene15565 [Halteria grandinella]